MRVLLSIKSLCFSWFWIFNFEVLMFNQILEIKMISCNKHFDGVVVGNKNVNIHVMITAGYMNGVLLCALLNLRRYTLLCLNG